MWITIPKGSGIEWVVLKKVALRFLNQKGIAIIPKSIHKDRIKENWEIFDFELTNDEMKEIELLDCDCSLFSWYE